MGKAMEGFHSVRYRRTEDLPRAVEDAAVVAYANGWNVYVFMLDGAHRTGTLLPHNDGTVKQNHILLDLQRELLVEWHNATHESKLKFVEQEISASPMR